MKSLNKISKLIFVVSLTILLAACGDEPADLTVMSFTDELQRPIDRFEEEHDVTVELQIIPTENYRETLQPVLESGDGAPDVFTGEIVYMQQWLDSGYWDNLSADPYNVDEWSEDYVDFVWDLGKDSEDNVRAISWQITPGGIYYRRSIAEEVLGTDDPAEVGEMMSTMDGLMDVGMQMNEAGYALFPDEGSISKFTAAFGANPEPWVDLDTMELNMNEQRFSYFDYAKELRDNQYTALAPAWSPAWFESFNGPISYNMGWDELEDAEEQATIEVFSVALPTWALDSVFKQEADANAGDWAVTNGPTSYFEGGTWLGVYEGSENKDLAFEFVKMMTNDEEFLYDWVEETGDVLSYNPVTDTVRENVSDEFLGGQNHYDFFLEEAEQIDAETVTPYDQQLNDLFGTQVGQFVEGEITKEEGIEEFYNEVENSFPEIIIPERE